LRQSGTYAPDAHSRWMGSIRLNGQNEIGLGYSISSTTVFPGIRYTGQSATAYANGTGLLDLAEQTAITGANIQTTYNRWGDYSGMSVDPSDDKTFWFTTQYVGPSQERKTRILSFQVGAAAPGIDLIPLTMAVNPVSVLDGQTTTASCSLKNQGTTVSGVSNLNYYLSLDNTYSAGDILLATDAVAAIGAGASTPLSKVVTIPVGTAPGTYYVLFYADADAQNTETNESNNVGSAQLTVTSSAGSPDLIVQNQVTTPTTVNAGATTSASCTVKNQGTTVAATSSLKYYLSADNVYNVTDTYLATSAVASLPANTTVVVSSVLTIPANTASGSWFLLFVADADAQVAESSEANNTASVAITVPSLVQGCNSTARYPSTTLTPTTAWKTQNSINAGEYTVFNVVLGRIYNFSYCSTDGATASYNSELTLRNFTTDAFIAYSDDACGDDAKIIWTATFTGTVKLVTTAAGCGTNTINTKLRYRYVTAKEAEGVLVAEEPSFQVFPNPSRGMISVEANSGFGNMKQITVFDAKGKSVRQVDIPEKSDNIYHIDLSDCASGMYVVKIIGAEKTEKFKVLLKK